MSISFSQYQPLSHMCFKRHKMGIKLNILSILLHPSQFVYNYILNNFVFINFFDFCLYMEELETLFVSLTSDHYGQGYSQIKKYPPGAASFSPLTQN